MVEVDEWMPEKDNNTCITLMRTPTQKHKEMHIRVPSAMCEHKTFRMHKCKHTHDKEEILAKVISRLSGIIVDFHFCVPRNCLGSLLV